MKVQLPEGAGVSLYTNHLLLDRIKAFQADLYTATGRIARTPIRS